MPPIGPIRPRGTSPEGRCRAGPGVTASYVLEEMRGGRIMAHRPQPGRRRRHPWANFPDEKLLALRLKDLDLSIEGTWLKGCLDELHAELGDRGLTIKPHAWISDDWFSPDNTPGIAFPFYLAHPRLMKLERAMLLEIEGGTKKECMRILRHEAGHVVQHAYKLHRRRKWQKLFGQSSTRYPSYYRPNPASQHFVQHLRLWYAQSHPDEDFAETFAVWLSPRSNWRRRYADWPALKKLEYVDELMSEIAGSQPLLRRRVKVDPLNRLGKTLGEYYKKKLAHYATSAPRTYDRDLLRIFSADPRHRRSPPAAAFIRNNRARLRRLVSKWTGEYQLTLDAVLDEMIDRCQELKLRAVGSERKLRLDFTVLLTAKTVHSLYSPSRRQWFAL
jgi:hypothetical protein